MHSAHPRDVVQHFIDALHREGNREEVIDRFSSDERLRRHILAFEAGFPGYRLIPKGTVVEGDSVALRFYADLHHTGTFRGLPPTGKRYRIEGLAFCHVRDGHIAQCWLESDMLGLMQTLHPTPGAAVES